MDGWDGWDGISNTTNTCGSIPQFLNWIKKLKVKT